VSHLDKAGSGSVEARVFNAVVDAIQAGDIRITVADIDSQASADGTVVTSDGSGNAAWEAGGGSQPMKLLGPFHVDYTNIANGGDVFDLATVDDAGAPAVDDWILNYWVDPATYVPFAYIGGTNANEIYIGNPIGVPSNDPPDNFWGKLKSDTKPFDASAVATEQRNYLGAAFTSLPTKVIAGAVQVCQELSGGRSPFTAGSMDVYLLVYRP
jgi:hypothetical protein